MESNSSQHIFRHLTETIDSSRISVCLLSVFPLLLWFRYNVKFWLEKRKTIHKKFIIDQLKSIQLLHCCARTVCWICTCIDKTDYKENDEVHSKITWKTAFLLRGLVFKTNTFFQRRKYMHTSWMMLIGMFSVNQI